MKYFFVLIIFVFLSGCTVNLYSSKVEYKPQLMKVTSISDDFIVVNLIDAYAEKFNGQMKISPDCIGTVEVGDLLLVDTVKSEKNGFEKFEIITPIDLSNGCLGKI